MDCNLDFLRAHVTIVVDNLTIIRKERKTMDIDPDDDIFQETTEIGSDELLSDDHLRLPETASMLVRLHALRAWLTRRMRDTELEIGNAALRLQESMQEDPQEAHPRR